MSTLPAALLGLTAAWVAAGSTGLLGHSLRNALTWTFAGAAIVAARPRGRSFAILVTAMAIAVALLVLLTNSTLPLVNATGVLIVVAVLAAMTPAKSTSPLRTATLSIAVFILYRLALHAIPACWLAADRVAHMLGVVAGWITGQRLSVGPTFGGVDFLVLSATYCACRIAMLPRPRARAIMACALAIAAAQFAYLAILSFVPLFLANVPAATTEQPNPTWSIKLLDSPDLTMKLDAVAIRQLIPSNLPALAVLFHLLVIAAVTRRTNVEVSSESGNRHPRSPISALAIPAAAVVTAILLAAAATWCTPATSLEGKKIVISDRLFGNFLKPQHGDYGHLSIGMYGNLQPFIESLGGRAIVSSDLSPKDLNDADALVLIYPNKPFFDEDTDHLLRIADPFVSVSFSDVLQQLQVDRVWNYVERGGTLLVMGEHTVAEENVPRPTRNYINQVLQRSAIRLNFDSAMFEIGGWLQSYQPLSHPITEGMEDSRNQFGVVIGGSLDVKYPARPVLIGRWGWADPGDEGSSVSMMGNHRYDPGERLDDLVLIAEQKIGKGRVVAFGDPSNVTNGITIGAHSFNARLYSYLTHNPEHDAAGNTPQSPRRQITMFLLAAVLLVLTLRIREPLPIAAVMLALSVCLWFWDARVGAVADANYPDGRKLTTTEIFQERGKLQPNYKQLAYIDDAHLGYYSEESWRPEGTMGLAMNLMRNGYLTLMAPDLKPDRLKGASLLVMPAPTRALSRGEREALKDWVDGGGQLVMTVGWDRYAPNRDLLADYGYYLEKIPLDQFPPEVVAAVRRARPGYEIVDGGVGVQNNLGCYVFDVRKGDEAFEVSVSIDGNAILEEREHTPDSLHHATVLRGALPPEPLGFFKVPYLSGLNAYVRFHAAWPIRSIDPRSAVAVVGRDELPLIIWRSVGKGKVVLIGDSEFATNQNLENEGGQPFEGLRENADFWRWFISYYLRGESPPWFPSLVPAPTTAPATPSPADDFNLEGK